MFTTDELDGKTLSIDGFYVTTVDQHLVLTMDAQIAKAKHRIIFQNISALQIDHFSYPVQIFGLAVTDHSPEGWSPDLRYEVYDFEDARLHFFCEDITLT